MTLIPVPVLMSTANLAALKRGLTNVEITGLRLARAIDGNYELYVEGLGPDPLPVHGDKPLVPLAS